MEKVSWIAGNGQEAEVVHVTEESNIADHTVVNKVDHIEVRLGGNGKIYQGIVDGMIQVMGCKIRIPDDKREAVMAMINGVNERRAARQATSAAIESDYQTQRAKVQKAMEA